MTCSLTIRDRYAAMKLRPLIALLLVNGLLTPNAQALDLGDHLRIEGFGTLGAFQGDDPVATVRADPRQKRGSSGNDLRYDADSLLAVQATVNPMGPIKGVVQLVAKQDDQASQKPKFEWVYLGWDIHTSMNLKVGRVVAPVFMTSDMRNVAFAQTMVRPMNTVYQMNPITNTDGANFKWHHRVGANEFGLEGMVGQSKVANITAQYEAKQVLGLGVRYAHGPWTIRAGVTDLKADITLSPSVAAKVDALKASVACTNCASVLNERLVLSNAKARIQTLGVAFDDDTCIFQAEYTTRPGNSVLVPNATGWYAMAGRRIQTWTPYVMVGQFKNTEANLGLQPASAPAAATIQFYNDSFVGLGRGDRTQWGAGVRWDFAPKFALKAQWDHYRIDHPTYGTNPTLSFDIPAPPATASTFDGQVNSLTVNLDFIF